MEMKFQCLVPYEILMEVGDWESLIVSPYDITFEIEKPSSREVIYLASDFVQQAQLGGPPKLDLETTIIRKGTRFVINTDIPTDRATQNMTAFFHEALWGSIRNLLAWIRVETHQFWVGYHESNDRYVNVAYSNSDGTVANRAGGHVGVLSEYGRPLTECVWLSLAEPLSKSKVPAPSRRFFCDALLDISEMDIIQAVVSLGVCCEIEVRDLATDLVQRQDQILQRIYEKYIKRQPFEEIVSRFMEMLGVQGFDSYDPEAFRLVSELYNRRGRAAHTGLSGFDQKPGDVLPAGLAAIPPYVKAVTTLFGWADMQRIRP